MSGLFGPSVPGDGIVREVADFPALLALTGVPDGREVTVLAPICTGGRPGIRFTRWAAAPLGWMPAGRQLVFALAAPVAGASGGSTAIQALSSAQFVAGALLACRRIDAFGAWAANATDAAVRACILQVGVLGDGSDTVASAVQTAANARGFSSVHELRPIDTTTCRSLQIPTSSNSQVNRWHNSVNAAFAAQDPTVTTPNLQTQQVRLTMCVQQGASPTAQITLTGFEIEIA